MTPTEQDKELREELYRLLKTDPRADTYVIPYRVMDIFVDFITADRKRVASSIIKQVDKLFERGNVHRVEWERLASEIEAQQEEVK